MKRRLIALLLCICMLSSMTVYATDDVTELTSEPTVPETTNDLSLRTSPQTGVVIPSEDETTQPPSDEGGADKAEGENETTSPTSEPTVPESSEAASDPIVPESSEAASEPTVPETSEAASEPVVPESSESTIDPTEYQCSCNTENDVHAETCALYVAPTTAEFLLTIEDVDALYMEILSLMQNQPDELRALTLDEVKAIHARAKELDPNGEYEYYADLMDTLQLLAGEYDLNDVAILPLDENLYTIIEVNNQQTTNRMSGADAGVDILDGVVYFDLSAGDISIQDSFVSGYRYDNQAARRWFVSAMGAYDWETVEFYIYQSGGDTKTGYYDVDNDNVKEMVLPKYSRVEYSGKSWGHYITGNTDVEGVITAWDMAVSAQNSDATIRKRIVTSNSINIGCYAYTNTPYSAQKDFKITIDNIWTEAQTQGQERRNGGITIYPYNANANNKGIYTLNYIGDNRLACIFYTSRYGVLYEKTSNYNPSSRRAELHLKSESKDQLPGSLTVADNADNLAGNFYAAAIGGSDTFSDYAEGIVIESGTLFAGTTVQDNATAIGGGGNGPGEITIKGGTVTAVSNSGGTAIGGGIGSSGMGGPGFVNIEGGTVYAYNFGPYEFQGGSGAESGKYYAPSAAIGSGSSYSNYSSDAEINISGGTVYAYSVGGVGIGGGGSAGNKGSAADITITGGNVTALSEPLPADIAENINYGNQSAYPASAGIGGGTGKTGGGDCTLTITGANTVVRTGSIGGGRTLDTNYKIGNATVEIKDGATVHGQVVMAKGANKDCSLTISDATINNSKDFGGDHQYYYIRDNGGVAYIENGAATVANSTIIGGGTDGMLDKGTVNDLTDDSVGNHIKNGGAFYVNGGSFSMTSGTIKNCVAAENGGAIYVTSKTDVTIGTEGISAHEIRIESNRAANGGAIYVDEQSSLTVYNGMIIKNSAIGHPETMPDITKTALDATCGVGGGIYIDDNSSFSLQGQKMGIHSNTADFAANDAYASGIGTKLSLPDVKGMDLEGFTEYEATGWFADYCLPDINYPNGSTEALEGTINPGRYVPKSQANVEITVEEDPRTLINHPGAYYCMTVGTNIPDNGVLTIIKTGDKVQADEVFVFEITRPESAFYLEVTIIGKGSVSIYDLPYGTYIVKEKKHWRYDAVADQTVDFDTKEETVTFENTRIEEKWLDSTAVPEVNVAGVSKTNGGGANA